MSDRSSVEKFLVGWLTARLRDEDVKKTVPTLFAALPTLLGGEAPRRFQEGLIGRVAGLKGLVEAINQHVGPTAPPNSPRGRWWREARVLATRWDEAKWASVMSEACREKNSIALAVVSQSFEEAVAPGAVHGPTSEHARKLRDLDDRPFRAIPLPPGPEAPWNASAYLFPAEGREIVERLANSPTVAASKDLAELFRLIDAGWPIPRTRLAGALVKLLELSPRDAELGGALAEVLQKLGSALPLAVPPANPTDPSSLAPDAVRVQVLSRLDDLARLLGSEATSEAQAFGRRLENLATVRRTATLPELHQELVGCLASLDEVSDSGASGRWRRAAMDRLARIAQELGGGEILDDGLLGQPLSRWTDFVTVVGFDDQAPPGEPRRITRIEASGYLLVFADGGRKALVRARVQIALG